MVLPMFILGLVEILLMGKSLIVALWGGARQYISKRECRIVVIPQLSKLMPGVRFPSLAPKSEFW